MDNKRRYKEMEQYLTYALVGSAVVFLLYMIFAGLGVVWLKVLTAIILVAVCGLALAWLYLTGELLRYRSRWMSVGFAAILVVLLVSLVLNYPSPNKYKNALPSNETSTTSVYQDIAHF